MLNKFSLFGIISLLIFSVSCKTVKTIENKKQTSNLDRIYDSLMLAAPVYKNLEAKFTIKFEDSRQTMDLKGTLRISKDSIIWISLSPGLGIDVVRFKCNRDSLYILDMLNKTYTKGNYKYIKDKWKVDVDFASLQSILTGNFFIYPAVQDDKSEFVKNFSIITDPAILKVYRKTGLNVENLLKIDQKSYKINDYLINDLTGLRTLSLGYGFQKLNEGFQFPQKIDIKSSDAGKFVNVILNYSKVQINSNPSFVLKVPGNYSIIDK